MRIGITGATGLIGMALAKAATQRGYGVVVFSRKKDLFLPWAKEIRPFDAHSPTVLDPSGLDALVHLAGENIMGRWTEAKKARIRDSRVEATKGIVEALLACAKRPPVFLCGSAIGAYGDRGDEVLTENSARGAGFLADVCAEWEAAACRAIPAGVRVGLLRTGMVLGQEGGAWPLLRRIFSWRLGSRLGNGKQWVSWVHLEDEAGIILDALDKPGYQGPINLTSPNPVTNATLTATMAQVLHKSTLPPTPRFVLRLVLGSMGGLLLDSQRVQPSAALAQGYTFRHPDLEEAIQSLLK